jgi:uncharacterized membrane protein
MREEKETAHRLAAYSDAVFAVIVTIMVLELRAPDQPAFSALWPLWPTAISYAVSYLFIAIIWINHHHLMRFAGPPTLRLIWVNFVHLFMVSLLPFATAWIARTRLASAPVVFYAGCSYASTLPTTSSSAKYSPARPPTKSPSVRGESPGADHSSSLRPSRPLCWLHSSRRSSALV